MENTIELLDCTLRDGAYVTAGKFGEAAIKGIIKKMENANVELIECGWLKNEKYTAGTSYYHVPEDLEKYLKKKEGHILVAMIDWDRYDLNYLPDYNGKTIDAIRVVFPQGKHKEGIEVAKKIKEKGYRIYLQAANTLAYSEEEMVDLADDVNKLQPEALSIVDTFGAMFEEDLDHILGILDEHLDKEIKIGFHSHNNMQLSFSLTCHFISCLFGHRGIIVDSSLNGMGRGAGNTTTELLANYLNSKYHKNYDLNEILDAIDLYMSPLYGKYAWGYSIPYFIAGMYQCHVNNIAYLQENHRTNSKDMRNIISSLSKEERRKYDYDLLERKYIENQNRIVDDEISIQKLNREFQKRKILLIGPGKTTSDEQKKVFSYIESNNPIIIFVNALNPLYDGDYLFLISSVRYEYAKEVYKEQFEKIQKILLSNIKTIPGKKETIINFDRVIKRGWEHFDNAIITCLRLLDKLHVEDVAIAGFDGFKQKYNESYADQSLPTLNPDNRWEELNKEIQDIFDDFIRINNGKMNLEFVTSSMFDK